MTLYSGTNRCRNKKQSVALATTSIISTIGDKDSVSKTAVGYEFCLIFIMQINFRWIYTLCQTRMA